MKFCTKGLKSEGDEIKLFISHSSENFVPVVEKVIDKNKRIVVDLVDLQESEYREVISYFLKLKSDGYAVAAIILPHTDPAIFKDNDIDFFFVSIVDTWDGIVSFAEAGVSDIEVGGELGFSLVRVSEYCHSRNIKVRVTANRAQYSSMIDNQPDCKKFFIRPEDVILYENIIDTIELYNSNQEIFKIYKTGVWKGELRSIIFDYNDITYNNTIPPYFGQKRMNCGKRCNSFGSCNLCNTIILMADKLHESKLEFVNENREEKEQTDN